jgi:hypothetical protein
MLQWIRPKYGNGLTKTIAISGVAFVFVLFFIFYFIWTSGAFAIIGIPLQMLLITLILPVAMVALIFRFARKLDWLENDE